MIGGVQKSAERLMREAVVRRWRAGGRIRLLGVSLILVRRGGLIGGKMEKVKMMCKITMNMPDNKAFQLKTFKRIQEAVGRAVKTQAGKIQLLDFEAFEHKENKK